MTMMIILYTFIDNVACLKLSQFFYIIIFTAYAVSLIAFCV